MGFRGARFQYPDRGLAERSKAAEEGADAVDLCLDSVRVESDRTLDDLPPPSPVAGDDASLSAAGQG